MNEMQIREYEVIRHGKCASAPGVDGTGWDSAATGDGETEEAALLCALGYLYEGGWRGEVDAELENEVSKDVPWYVSLRVRA